MIENGIVLTKMTLTPCFVYTLFISHTKPFIYLHGAMGYHCTLVHRSIKCLVEVETCAPPRGSWGKWTKTHFPRKCGASMHTWPHVLFVKPYFLCLQW